MNKKASIYVFMFLMALATVQQLISQSAASKFEKVAGLGGMEDYRYGPNGMNLLLLQDNSAPVVNVQIVYHVGSKHEVLGNTGAVHLLEYLMFRGTEKFNKRKGTSIDSKFFHHKEDKFYYRHSAHDGKQEQTKDKFHAPPGWNKTEVVTIPQRPGAELFVRRYTGLTGTDADYIPFFIGNYTLGGGFSGRLMRAVRDEEELTYSIGTQHQGHSFGVGGNWVLNASFNPQLFQTGLDATMAQLKKWQENGITQKGLHDKKSNLIGSFKVGMSSTVGIATTLLGFLERGLPPGYIDQYPEDIRAVTLDQVNRTIKKYIDLDKLVIVKSGLLDENGGRWKYDKRYHFPT